MKSIKRIIKSGFAIVLAMIMLFGVACKKNSGGGLDVSPKPPEQDQIYFNQQVFDLFVGDTSTLVAFGYKQVEGQTLVFQSLDRTVATVNSDGLIEAVNEGTTKIVASYGNTSAECVVNVSYIPHQIPSIITNENATFNVNNGATYKFEPKIKYRNTTYNDGSFSYEIEDPNVVEMIEDGTIRAKAKGKTDITIKGSWRAFDFENNPSLSMTVSVSVIDTIRVEVENIQTDFVNLYTLAEFNGTNYQNQVNFVPSVFVNGVAQSNDNVNVVITDTNVAKYEDGKVIGLTFGSTIIKVEVGEGADKFVEQYELNVIRPTAKFDKTANYFSSHKGTLRDETNSFANITLAQFIYGKTTDKVITDATYNGQQLTISENKVLGITGTDSSTYEATICVGTATEIYEVDMVVYGVYLYDLADLDVFVRGENDRQLDCYVELARDLDANGFSLREHFLDNKNSAYKPTIKKNYDDEIKGFTGTFNGKGHSINNLTVGEFGLMCVMYQAKVLNVGFNNVNIEGGGFFAENVMFSDFENVYVDVASMKEIKGGSNVIARYVVRGGSFKNVYVNAQAIKKANDVLQGAFLAIEAGRTGAQAPLFENCIILADLPTGISTDTSTWGQVVVTDNISAQVEKKDEVLNFIWNNIAFESMKKTITTAYNEKFPSGTVSSLAIQDVDKMYSLTGVRQHFTEAEAKADENTVEFINKFVANECWSLKDGFVAWGAPELNADEGQIYLNVGSVAGQMVEGFNGNPLTPAIGSVVKLNKLTCFGYKFIGWKNYETGVMITPNAKGEYIVTNSYDGKSMQFVAVWEKDSNVSSGPEIEL